MTGKIFPGSGLSFPRFKVPEGRSAWARSSGGDKEYSYE